MKILTISIAAYHVERYLPETLDSLLIPQVQDQLEVLIINDGSGEGVNEIAREYEQRYPQVFRLIDKENGGHGSTVNRGIEEATGRYFKTVDGDDRVDALGFAKLLEYLTTATEDLVVTDYVWFEDQTDQILDIQGYDFPGRVCGETYTFDEISEYMYINMHAATFRTSLLKKMDHRLDEHCFYVDTEYMLYPIPYVETVAFLPHTVYQYRMGLATQSVDIHNMQKNCAHHEKVLTHLMEFYQERETRLTPAKRRYIAKGVARVLVSQYKIYLSYPPSKAYKDKIRSWEKRMKRECPTVYHSTQNPVILALRMSGYCLYRPASLACRKAYHVTKNGE